MDSFQYNFGTKVCKTCTVAKPTYEFYMAQGRHLHAHCKGCYKRKYRESAAHREMDRLRAQQRRQTPEGIAEAKAYRESVIGRAARNRGLFKYILKSRYGIEAHDWANMYEAQEHKCVLCHKYLSVDAACVDHDHKSGRVRGLLCIRCNTGLGYVESFDMPKVFSYLNAPRARGL